jgi:hypothetical protein
VQATLATEEEKVTHFLMSLDPPKQTQEEPADEEDSRADKPET